MEKFTRLIVWRDGDTSKPFSVWGHQRVGMGDKPAALALEIGADIAAEQGQYIDKVAADKLVNDRYADDVLSGADVETVQRMVGNKIEDDMGNVTYTGTMAQILDLVSFKAKTFTVSGDSNHEKEGKVLGHMWLPENDMLEFKLVINLHQKQGALKTGPDLSVEDVPRMSTFIYTKRIALQISSQFFDPTGLISVYLIRFKLALKDLVPHKLGWDEPLPDTEQVKWRRLVQDVLEAEAIEFPRNIKTDQCIGRPECIAYFDGSDKAYCAVIYCRWRLIIGGWHARLVSSKVRVTNDQIKSTPRSEMSALVLCTRILDSVYKAMEILPMRLTVIGDSTCTISSCELSCTSQTPFFSNRVAEILDTMQSWGPESPVKATQELEEIPNDDTTMVDQIWHTPGPKNPADLPTRGTVAWNEIGLDSLWQCGPTYLQQDRAEWPINRDFIVEVPPEVLKTKYFKLVNHFTALDVGKIFHMVNDIMGYSTKLQLVRGITSRVVRSIILDSRESISRPLTVADYANGDHVMEWVSVQETLELLKSNPCTSLSPFWWHGKVCTRGRLGKSGMMMKLGHAQLILLSPQSRFAKLLMYSAHSEDHRQSPGDILWRTRRRGFWIIRGRNLAKTVASKCLVCKIRNQQPVTQIMGDLPDNILETENSPWKHIALDYLGPVNVRDVRNKRLTVKVYPILYTCLQTRALHVNLAMGYSTDQFFTAYDDFVALRGCPATVFSDAGSQLIKASNLVEDPSNEVSWSQVAQSTAKQGTVWTTAPPGAQFRNGRMESLCRQFKKTMHHLSGGGSMTYHEFLTMCRQACNIINDRPVGYRHHSGAEGELQPITPNMLLVTSRTDSAIPILDEHQDKPDKFARMLKFRERCLSEWWQQWYSVAFDSFVIRPKWKTSARNVAVGDLVLIRGQGKLVKGDYRRGRVVSVLPSKDGKVRTVRVRLYKPDSRRDVHVYSGEGHVEVTLVVQRLVVLLPIEEQEESSGHFRSNPKQGESAAGHEVMQPCVNHAMKSLDLEEDRVSSSPEESVSGASSEEPLLSGAC